MCLIDERDHNTIYVTKSSKQIIEFIRILKERDNFPFDNLEFFRGRNNFKEGRPLKRLLTFDKNSYFWSHKENIKDFTDLNFKKSHIYVFNDRIPLYQYILYRNYLEGGKNTCIEEGFSFYEVNTVSIPPVKKILTKILIGKWYEWDTNQAQSKYLDEIRCFFPEILPIKDAKKLDTDILDNFPIDSNRKEVSLENKILLVAPLSSSFKSSFKKTEFEEKFKIMNREEEIIVKYHPLEEEDYLDNIINQKLGTHFPLEYYYLATDEPPKKVIGSVSTALYTAKVCFEDTDVISLPEIEDCSKNMVRKLNQMGVMVRSLKSSLH